VIVFSVKGNPSLASKLSGGDYDGDKAWICWEPAIVQCFDNTELPECPDLVKKGYLTKVSTKYVDLVSDQPHPTSYFLKRSFEFNMEENLLGKCTKFKESFCYKESIRSREAIWLSTLLSHLVDQAKTGVVFTEDRWQAFVGTVVKQNPAPPPYWRNELVPKPRHIIDRLKCVANDTVEQTLKDLHEKLPTAKYWDGDLVVHYEAAKAEAKSSRQWKSMLENLENDLKAVKDVWSRHFAPNGKESDLVSRLSAVVTECYDLYCAIRPAEDSELTRISLQAWKPKSEYSPFELLKASTIFAMESKIYVSKFVWYMAGKQLAYIKASGSPGMRVAVPHMAAMQKPDATFVKLTQSEAQQRMWEKDEEASEAGDCAEREDEME